MASTYTWTFNPLEVSAAEIDGHADVIKTVHWRISAISDDDLTASAYGAVPLDEPEDGFVAFDDVTREQVKRWVLTSLDTDEAAVEAALDAQIDTQRTPPMLNKQPAAWSD
jgi:hypothetical protein|tara:strand:- start:56 stop:388 length:333 start_codon:yes stop_codon:yes gene_type:complete